MTEKSSINPLIWFGIGIAFVIFVYTLVAFFDTREDDLTKASANYQQGEVAQTIAERKESFNQAISLYLKLESEHRPIFGNGKLYYNLGNTYFQLSEYPLAIWSYSNAKKLMPRNANVEHNLNQALQKAGVSNAPPNFIEKINNYFSLPERLQFILFFLMLIFIFFSLRIWFNPSWLKFLIIPLTLTLFFFLSSVFYTQFIDPAKAIVLKGTSLYRDAGIQYAKVKEKPLIPGSKVDVLQVTDGGRWIKIMTEDGFFGYVQFDSLKIIM